MDLCRRIQNNNVQFTRIEIGQHRHTWVQTKEQTKIIARSSVGRSFSSTSFRNAKSYLTFVFISILLDTNVEGLAQRSKFLGPIHRGMGTVKIGILWSSLDKGESLSCQITSPFNKNIHYFEGDVFNFTLKTTQLFVKWGSYLASQWLSSLSKELHGCTYDIIVRCQVNYRP